MQALSVLFISTRLGSLRRFGAAARSFSSASRRTLSTLRTSGGPRTSRRVSVVVFVYFAISVVVIIIIIIVIVIVISCVSMIVVVIVIPAIAPRRGGVGDVFGMRRTGRP